MKKIVIICCLLTGVLQVAMAQNIEPKSTTKETTKTDSSAVKKEPNEMEKTKPIKESDKGIWPFFFYPVLSFQTA